MEGAQICPFTPIVSILLVKLGDGLAGVRSISVEKERKTICCLALYP